MSLINLFVAARTALGRWRQSGHEIKCFKGIVARRFVTETEHSSLPRSPVRQSAGPRDGRLRVLPRPSGGDGLKGLHPRLAARHLEGLGGGGSRVSICP